MSKADTPSRLGEAPRRLHPASMIISVIRKAPSTLLGIPALLAVVARADWWMVVTGGITAALAVALVRLLTWYRFTYALAADAIVIESGVFSRNRRTIPYERLADIGIERGPLQRVFALAKVTLETGGSGIDEGSLDSVSCAEAERLRAALQRRRTVTLENPSDGAEKAATVPVAETPLFAMSTRRVLLWGFFNFSLVWIAIGLGALQYLAGLLNVDRSALLKTVAASTDTVRSLPVLAWVGALAAGTMVVLTIGLTAGIGRTMLRDHAFKLINEEGRLRRMRGLFTRSETIISLPRVQLAVIDDGLLRRHFGWSRLRTQLLGGEGAEGLQDLAPLAHTAEVDRLLIELRLPRRRPDALCAVARGHVWRALLRRTAIPTLLILGASWFYPPTLLALALLGPLCGLSLLERRHHRYGFTPGLLQVQRGVLTRHTWVIPVSRIQTVTLRQTWIQRRLRLTSIFIDTAGANRFYGPNIHDVYEADGWMLIGHLSEI
ncbi:PH domain-containing protein [Sphingomonas cynarae]|uniref:PH domain-containing protein n=1 Tax=Sphingomonas cynarae TaxID=930197 RepID=A0ABP7EHG8_9SPHN